MDLSRPLSGEQMQDLRQAYLDYSVLVFRDQHNLNNEQLLTFASVFGDVVNICMRRNICLLHLFIIIDLVLR